MLFQDLGYAREKAGGFLGLWVGLGCIFLPPIKPKGQTRKFRLILTFRMSSSFDQYSSGTRTPDWSRVCLNSSSISGETSVASANLLWVVK